VAWGRGVKDEGCLMNDERRKMQGAWSMGHGGRGEEGEVAGCWVLGAG